MWIHPLQNHREHHSTQVTGNASKWVLIQSKIQDNLSNLHTIKIRLMNIFTNYSWTISPWSLLEKNISFCCLSPILFPPHASPIIFANVPASFKTISSHSITAYINSSIYNQFLWFSNLSWFNYTFYWLNPSFEWLKRVKTHHQPDCY